MASLQPQTSVNPTKFYFLTDPVSSNGITFVDSSGGGDTTSIINVGGILETPTGDILNSSYWSQFPASTGYIDMDSTGNQRITATDSQLFYNGLPLASGGNVADWSYFPVDSGFIDFSGPTQRLTATDTNLVYNGVPLTGGEGEGWSIYPALQNVDMSGFSLTNVTSISSDQNLLLTCANNMTLTVPNIYNATAIRYAVVAGSIAHPESPAIIDLSTSNGSFGEINLTANPGVLGFNGAVYITANGGTDPTGTTAYGGNITIQANTPINTEGVTFSSAVKISGASVLSYAGLVPPIGSNTGINYIFGNLGVSITSDVAGPLIPPTPLSVYIFGRTGTSIPSVISDIDGSHSGGIYCADVQPYSNGITTSDLYIKGRGTNLLLLPPLVGNVILENVKTLDGNIFERDPSGGLFVVTRPALDIVGLVSINNAPYANTQDWATFPAVSNVVMDGNSITTCSDIQVDTINGIPATPKTPIYFTYGADTETITEAWYGRMVVINTTTPTATLTLIYDQPQLPNMYFTLVVTLNVPTAITLRIQPENSPYILYPGQNYEVTYDPFFAGILIVNGPPRITPELMAPTRDISGSTYEVTLAEYNALLIFTAPGDELYLTSALTGTTFFCRLLIEDTGAPRELYIYMNGTFLFYIQYPPPRIFTLLLTPSGGWTYYL
jgi:hypothetical protein